MISEKCQEQGKYSNVESSTLVLNICICYSMSAMFVCVQCSISREVRGRKGRMGDNLWSGLGEMFGFSWHLHFHYPGLHDLSCFPLRINHIPDILSLYPVFVSLSHHPTLYPASSISSRGPGLVMMTAVRLSVSPGVSGSLVSSHHCQPIRGQYGDQWPIRGQYGDQWPIRGSCHPVTHHLVTWEHKNNLPSTTNRFGQYLFLPKSVKSPRL